MNDAPYQRIAAEIRQRIRTGRLKPGDRAPSTRALIRDHGIAMATATKALALLQQELLIDARPREFRFPARHAAMWRDGVGRAVRLQWAAWRRQLWLPSAVSLSRPQLIRNLVLHTDAVLRALTGFDLDPSPALYAAITVFG